MKYNNQKVEKKIQKLWKEQKTFKTNLHSNKPKFYALDMFPYPSGAGLHVGHPEGYTATDIISRMKKLQGYEVLHPIGWDAFGLPSEQYAIKTGNSPKDFTLKNIANFKKQLISLGFSFDWDRELNTTDENYYKNTQWIFAQLFKNGLAELKEIKVNWSPSLNTVLSNEEVLTNEKGEKVGERDGLVVVERNMEQWVLKITKYAKKLFDGLENLDWPDSVKKIQRNWIYEKDKENNFTDKLHLKDWIFARQRYWGEPFPIIHFEDGEIYLIPEENYPIKLPKIKDYKFSKDGLPALSKAKDWIEVEIEGRKGKRDLNTMPQWAGSCWYYIAYLLKKDEGFYSLDSKESKEILDKWLPVDLYIGGQEHAVLHLMYARFWHIFLSEIGITKVKEPFQKLFNQGMILGSDNQKMSKSKGNVINPDEIIEEFGADTLRAYEMFMGPLEDKKSWSDAGIVSMRKWLEKVYKVFLEKVTFVKEPSLELKQYFNKMISNVTNMYENLKFNVSISEMMIFINYLNKNPKIDKDMSKKFLITLSCIAPHITEEIWILINDSKDKTLLSDSSWPEEYNVPKLKVNSFVMIQINGKIRGKLPIKDFLSIKDNETKIIEKVKEISPNFFFKEKLKKIIIKDDKIISIILSKD